MFFEIKKTVNSEIIAVTFFLFALVISSFVILYGVLPYGQDVAVSQGNVTKYEKLLANKGDRNREKEKIEQRYEALEKKYNILTQGMVDSKDISSMLDMLLQMADKSGFRFEKTVPQKAITTSDNVLYPILLESVSSYNDFVRFTAALEKIPQRVSINRINIIAEEDNKIRSSMLITCYLSPRKEGLKKNGK